MLHPVLAYLLKMSFFLKASS